MAVETFTVPAHPHHAVPSPRWLRRLFARYRCWRIVTRREIRLAALDQRQRVDIGWAKPAHYRWLDELVRAQLRR